MTETELEEVANISMKKFRKNTHFSFKDILEKQPILQNYERAFYITLDYGEIFFTYNSIIKD